jgi:prevent-host-death family protein
MEWALQDAKNRLSEVVRRAREEGPQVVTLRGARAAVIVSAEAFDQMTAQRPNLVEHLLSGPLWPADLHSEVTRRAKAPSRRDEF